MFNDCPKKWSLQYKEGQKQFTSTIHTVFGTAIHEVIQNYLTVMYESSMVEDNVTKIKKDKTKVAKKYHEEIIRVDEYTEPELDSFFSNRYK
jgi:hypothetical protein